MTSHNNALKISAAALIFFSLALPSGSILGIPLKHIAYLACFLSLIITWSKNRSKIEPAIILLFLLISSFVAFFILLGSFQGTSEFNYVILEGTGVFTAVTIVLILISAISTNEVTDKDLVKFTFFGALAFALWKVTIVLLLVSGFIKYQDVYYFFTEYAGYRPVSSGIFGGLVRFNFIIYDFVVAVFLYLIPAHPKLFNNISKPTRIIFLFVGLLCLIFAFSRLLFLLVTVLWAHLFFFKLTFGKKLVALTLSMVVLVPASPWISGAIEQRFSGVHSEKSDDIRSDQIVALINTWSESPVIGGGFGHYSKKLIRDQNAPFSYEVQWIGFLAKLGIVGVGFLVFFITLLYYKVLTPFYSGDQLLLAAILTVFVLGGFTNQYLVSSASGVFYSLIFFASSYLKRTSNNNLNKINT